VSAELSSSPRSSARLAPSTPPPPAPTADVCRLGEQLTAQTDKVMERIVARNREPIWR
jgi:hypothetical protein